MKKPLTDVDKEVRSTAADALGKLGRHVAPAVPGLAKLLTVPDKEVRHKFTDALGKLDEYMALADGA